MEDSQRIHPIEISLGNHRSILLSYRDFRDRTAALGGLIRASAGFALACPKCACQRRAGRGSCEPNANGNIGVARAGCIDTTA